MFHLPTLLLGIAAFLIVRANRLIYDRKVRRLEVPRRPFGQQLIMVAGIAVAGVAFSQGGDLVGLVLATLAVLGGAKFIITTLTSRLPTKSLPLAVGQPAPDFTAIDQTGRT